MAFLMTALLFAAPLLATPAPMIDPGLFIEDRSPQETRTSSSDTPLPTVASTAPLETAFMTRSAPAAAYATGTCHIHLIEVQSCEGDDTNNLSADIAVYDAAENLIKSDSQPINAGSPYTMDISPIPGQLVVTGEHSGGDDGYVQFTHSIDPPASWQSTDKQGDVPGAYCNAGGWTGEVCLKDLPIPVPGIIPYEMPKNRTMDCYFTC